MDERSKQEREALKAEEDRKVLEALDELVRDPPCGHCGSPRTSEGSTAGCDYCIVREVMES